MGLTLVTVFQNNLMHSIDSFIIDTASILRFVNKKKLGEMKDV